MGATEDTINRRAGSLWVMYVWRRLYEQFAAVGLISSYLVVFHWLVLGQPPSSTILLAMLALVVGAIIQAGWVMTHRLGAFMFFLYFVYVLQYLLTVFL